MRRINLITLLVLYIAIVASRHAARAADGSAEAAKKPASRDFDKVIADATDAIRRNPKDAEAYVRRGEAREDREDNRNRRIPTRTRDNKTAELKKSMDDYAEAIRLKPDLVVAHVRLGNMHRMREEYEKAFAELDKAIELGRKGADKNPKDLAMAYRERGLAYVDRRKYDAAIADYNEAIRLEPDSEAAFHRRGYAREETFKFDEAIADYTEAIRLAPDDADGYVDRSSAYNKKRDCDHCIADATKAMSLDPNWAEAHNELGIGFDRFAHSVIAADDKTADALFDRASAYFDGPPRRIDAAKPLLPFDGSMEHFRTAARKLDRAHKAQLLFDYSAAAFKSAIELYPDYDFGNNNLAVYYARPGRSHDLATAEKYFRAALKANPRYADAYNNLGIVLEEQGDFDGAIAAHNACLALRDNYASDHNNLCRVYLQIGELDSALKENDAAVKCDPKYLGAWASREEIFFKKSDLAEAANCVRRMIAIDAKSGDAVNADLALARKYVELNRTDDAIAALDEFLRANQSVAIIYYTRAQVYNRKGDLPRAKLDLEQTARLLPHDPVVKKELEKVNAQLDAAQRKVNPAKKSSKNNGDN